MSDLSIPSFEIISGGQTGVDRAALDTAIELNIPHSGWCPFGRIAEDGKIDNHYNLRETVETDYLTRTRLNVQDADGTLIINSGSLDGGTRATVLFASELDKPHMIIDVGKSLDSTLVHDWLKRNKIRVLNIAGPRESKRPGIYQQTRKLLLDLIKNYSADYSVQAI